MESYQLSRSAEQDVWDCYQFGVKKFGYHRAKSYLEGLHAKLSLLSLYPKLGYEVPFILPRLRKFPYASHIIYYQPTLSTILVIRFLRKNMDFKKHYAANDE